MKDMAMVGVRMDIPKGIRVKVSDPQHRTKGAKSRANGTPKGSYVSSDKPDGLLPNQGRQWGQTLNSRQRYKLRRQARIQAMKANGL